MALMNTRRLGTQTNVGLTDETQHWLAGQWSPKRAKSYSIRDRKHIVGYTAEYNGFNYRQEMEHETGFSSFVVDYFSCSRGEHRIADCPVSSPF